MPTNQIDNRPLQNDENTMLTHPYNIAMVLFLTSLTMIFVGLSAAYLYTRVQTGEAPIKIPLIFLANTVVLYASTYLLKIAKNAYIADNTALYQRSLVFTLLLTLLFGVLQFVGWEHLLAENPNVTNGNMRAYLYAISIIHFLHILGGLPFFIAFTIVAYLNMKEPVTVLVYFSDPLKRLRLRLLTMYWNFLDYLWIYLMLFFWINYFVKIG